MMDYPAEPEVKVENYYEEYLAEKRRLEEESKMNPRQSQLRESHMHYSRVQLPHEGDGNDHHSPHLSGDQRDVAPIQQSNMQASRSQHPSQIQASQNQGSISQSQHPAHQSNMQPSQSQHQSQFQPLGSNLQAQAIGNQGSQHPSQMGSRLNPGASHLQSNVHASHHPSNLAGSHQASQMHQSRAIAGSHIQNQPQEGMVNQSQLAGQSQFRASLAPRSQLYQSAMNLAEQHEVDIPEEDLPHRHIPSQTTIVKKPEQFGSQNVNSSKTMLVNKPLGLSNLEQSKIAQPTLHPSQFTSFEEYLKEYEQERISLRQIMDKLKKELQKVTSDSHLKIDDLNSHVAMLNKDIADVDHRLNQNEVASLNKEDAKLFVLRKESIQNAVVSKIKRKFGESEAKVDYW